VYRNCLEILQKISGEITLPKTLLPKYYTTSQQVSYDILTFLCGVCCRFLKQQDFRCIRTVKIYFNVPTVTVAEALGSPKRRRLSVVNEVNIVILDVRCNTVCHVINLFSTPCMLNRCSYGECAHAQHVRIT